MSQSKTTLPPGWKLSLSGYYHWADPKERNAIPDIYIDESGEEWEIEYWVKRSAYWTQVCVPSPEPPFELAKALYYAAQ